MSLYWRLIRPGLLLTVLFSMAIAAWRPPNRRRGLGWRTRCWGRHFDRRATAMNQLLEHRGDAAMARTALRPLPAGQATTRHVALFAVLASAAGIADLAVKQPPIVTLLAASSWVISC